MNDLKFTYKGDELTLFQHATKWKAYWQGMIHKHIRGSVLEVGAGIGANTLGLYSHGLKKWVCLEPDVVQAKTLQALIASGPSLEKCQVVQGFLSDLDSEQKFDSILYIDVIEHIEKDSAEFLLAASYLQKGGKLIVISPAHQFLFSPFDASIGHFRRYNKKTLSAIAPKNLKITELIFLDSIGLLASAMNSFILKTASPSLSSILFWDRVMVPISKILDPLIGHSIGKSILMVCEKLD